MKLYIYLPMRVGFDTIFFSECNIVGRGAQEAGKLVTTPLVPYNELAGKTGDLTIQTQKMDEKYHDGKSTLWTCSDGNEQG